MNVFGQKDKPFEIPEEDGTVFFYVDNITKDVVYAINGEDNSRYYSYAAVKDGKLGYPSKLNFLDMWFSQSHTLPEIKGYTTLVNADEYTGDSFYFKNEEIENKYNDWKKSALYGKISSNRNAVNIHGSNSQEMMVSLRFFLNRKYLRPDSYLYVDGKLRGILKEVLQMERYKCAKKSVVEDPDITAIVNKYKTTNDHESALTLLSRYDNMIRAVINKYVRTGMLHTQDVEDVIQTSYIKFLGALKTFDPKRAKLSTYAYRTIENTVYSVINEKAQYQRDVSLQAPAKPEQPKTPPMEQTLVDKAPMPQEQVQQQEMEAAVKEFVDSLPQIQKDVIQEMFWSGKTLDEVGRNMNMSRQRVKQVLDQGLEALRTKFRSAQRNELVKIAMLFGKEKPKITLCKRS